jgi:hypothetical protein
VARTSPGRCGFLARQTIARELEVPVGAPSSEQCVLAPETCEAFGELRVLSVGPVRTTGPARARLMQAARGTFVVTAEDHCYPDPGWAAALVRAQRGPWAAVGPTVVNANPRTALSWADFLLNYAHAAEPLTEGEAPDTAWHNTANKREAVAAQGEDLGRLLDESSELTRSIRSPL